MKVKKIIIKLVSICTAFLLALSCMIPAGMSSVNAIGGGLTQYGTFYPEHTVSWYDGTGFGSSTASYTEGGKTYYQDGSIICLTIKLPVNNKSVAIADDIVYNPSQLTLLSSYAQIGQSQDSYYDNEGWSAYVAGDTTSSTEAVIHYINDVVYNTPDTHTDSSTAIARIYFQVKAGVTTDAGTGITFSFPSWQVADAEFNFMTPNYDPSDSAGTYKTTCDPVTITAKNPSITFNASNGFITQTQAKAINTASDLAPYNKVAASVSDGTAINVNANTSSLTNIKNGVLGTYNVTYSYNYGGLSDSKAVSLTVVTDDTVISDDGVNALTAKDGIITSSEAKALGSTSQLIALNGASVQVNDGTTATPNVSCNQFSSVQAGTVGDYAVTYSYGTGKGSVSKTVNLAVVPDGSIISPNKDFALYAKDGFIKQSEAKSLSAKNDLISYNGAVVYLASGGTTTPTTSVSSNSWAEIKSGEKGNYSVYYSYGSGTNETEKQVSITVVGDDDVISESGKYALGASNIELTASEAKALSAKSELINLAKAEVTEVGTGTKYTPTVTVSNSNWSSIQAGTVGSYSVTFSYGTGKDAVTKTVTMSVVKDPVNEVTAENASISQTQAKALTSQEDLLTINNVVVTAVDGTHPAANITAADWTSIKAGIVGSYNITYSYGSGSLLGTTTVKLNVYKDGSAVNEDGSLYAENGLLTQTEAKALNTKTDLIAYNDASVTLNDGTSPKPNVTISTADWVDVKDGVEGTYSVTYSYTTAHGTLSKTVSITVVKDGSIISPDKTASIYAKDGFITVSQAKALAAKNGVAPYNSAVVTVADGTHPDPTVTITDGDWLLIKKGTEGNYTIMYTYGSGTSAVEKSVNLTVIDDDAVISKDGQYALSAVDGSISNDDAKKLNSKSDLIPYNEVKVVKVDGTTYTPTVNLSSSSFADIKDGQLGDYSVTYSYGTSGSNDYVSRTVKLSVIQLTRDVYMFDYNENNTIDIADKATFNYYFLHNSSLTKTQIILSDYNGNEKVDVGDKAGLNNYLANPSLTPPIVAIPV
ncbi:MAG: hypothetical protein PHH04_07015 [Thomasclavelia sp.]|nr:hypothetical protein [Thomasclavelia sp.]